jgi:hypothetical protein
MAIHVFGDSHAKWCFRNIKECVIHLLGPITMHRVGRDGIDFLDLRNHDVLEKDVAVFVFGEIDVRSHIGRQRDEKGRTLDEILDALAKNYIGTVLRNRENYNQLQCIVFAVIPPTHNKEEENPEFPFFGSIEDRVQITRELNKRLIQGCLNHGISVLNVYDLYCTEKGDLKEIYVDVVVHIRTKYNRPIKKQLNKILKNPAGESHEFSAGEKQFHLFYLWLITLRPRLKKFLKNIFLLRTR